MVALKNLFFLTSISGILLFSIINYYPIQFKNLYRLLENENINVIKIKLKQFIEYIPVLHNIIYLRTEVPEESFSIEELAQFNGEIGSKGLYLAIFGKVYDVEKGIKHYGPGGSYHFFAGRDASKAFITGDFRGSGAADDVLSLQPEELVGINQWLSFYENEYTYKGKLIGRYYDSYGNPTEYQKRVMKTLQEVEEKKRKSEDIELKYPPCNSEWNRDSDTKVWCSKMSGGIRRDWIGVPRMLYSPGSDSHRCACVKDPDDPSIKRNIREYPGCPSTSASCRVYTR